MRDKPDLLKEDLPLPVLVLKRSALAHNRRWMRRFLALTGLKIAPHGKTPVSPEMVRMQMRDGAWGITAATTAQVRVFRDAGAKRILFANELAGRANVRSIVDELNRDPAFDFYCLVDSPEGVAYLASLVRSLGLRRPLQVLLEVGVRGGRAGCRSIAAAMRTARAVRAAAPTLLLRGVEGYEGAIPHAGDRELAAFYAFMKSAAVGCEKEGLFAPGPVILSAGSTACLDRVYAAFKDFRLGRPHVTVVRSGCYITSDHVAYGRYFDAMLERMPAFRKLGPKPVPALELWAYVLSVPEPGLAIVGFGRRECPFDKGLPAAVAALRPGVDRRPRPLGRGHAFTALNDQHAFLEFPRSRPLRVGDMVCAGISHPCGAFEKWRQVPVVDDRHRVVSLVHTRF